jgi:hypothetical protein
MSCVIPASDYSLALPVTESIKISAEQVVELRAFVEVQAPGSAPIPASIPRQQRPSALKSGPALFLFDGFLIKFNLW